MFPAFTPSAPDAGRPTACAGAPSGPCAGYALSAVLLAVLVWCMHAGPARAANAPSHPVWEPPDPLSAGAGAGPNLFLHARVTASGHWDGMLPEYAVDGRRDRARHWACENIPVWLTVDMGAPKSLSMIRLWTWWGDGRVYRFHIEGSEDGQRWRTLADERNTNRPSSAAGWTFLFEPVRVRYVRTTFTHNSRSNVAGGHIVEIEGYDIPDDVARTLRSRDQAWSNVAPGLHGAVVSVNDRFEREAPPGAIAMQKSWEGAGWRGERVSAQIVLWTQDGARQVRPLPFSLVSTGSSETPAIPARIRFVRYVLADGRLVGDALDARTELDIPPRTVRPVWITFDIPRTASPGRYEGTLRVRVRGKDGPAFPFALNVLPRTLPPPAEWSFHLNIWQHPWAAARVHRVEPWSEPHWTLLRPILRMLADAGQKCITIPIVERPWNQQTYDAYGSMVAWTRRPDGTWFFDFSLFDRYVRFAAECGLTGTIQCYSMVPWGNRIGYRDAKTGDYHTITLPPGSPEWRRTWTAFLRAFRMHLRERGWLDRTAIAMDERSLPDMRAVIDLVHAEAPELGIALAGRPYSDINPAVTDYCVHIGARPDRAFCELRKQKNQPLTFYVCCGPRRPNTFTFSPPAESAWLPLYAAARGYDGFLRWAFNHWNHDPLWDTSYGRWPAGDCFLIYPGPRSSVRWERLRDGIEAFEKLRILRTSRNSDARTVARQVQALLSKFRYPAPPDEILRRETEEVERVLNSPPAEDRQ